MAKRMCGFCAFRMREAMRAFGDLLRRMRRQRCLEASASASLYFCAVHIMAFERCAHKQQVQEPCVEAVRGATAHTLAGRSLDIARQGQSKCAGSSITSKSGARVAQLWRAGPLEVLMQATTSKGFELSSLIGLLLRLDVCRFLDIQRESRRFCELQRWASIHLHSRFRRESSDRRFVAFICGWSRIWSSCIRSLREQHTLAVGTEHSADQDHVLAAWTGITACECRSHGVLEMAPPHCHYSSDFRTVSSCPHRAAACLHMLSTLRTAQ
eukprot:4486093-Pleurochrysis_carterae.AAC.1